MKIYALGLTFLLLLQSCENSGSAVASTPITNPTLTSTSENEAGVIIIKEGSLNKIANTDDSKCFILHLNDEYMTTVNTCSLLGFYSDDLVDFQKVNVGTIYRENDRCYKKIFYIVQFEEKSYQNSEIENKYRFSNDKILQKCP